MSIKDRQQHAPSGVRHDPSLEKVRSAGKGRKLPSRTKNLLESGEIKGSPTRKSSIALEGVKDSSKGSGATPTGVARATPMKTQPSEEPLLEHKRLSRDSGATVKDINRGYPNQHP